MKALFCVILSAFGLIACGPSELPSAQNIKLQLPDQPYEYRVPGMDNAIPTLGRVLFYDRQLSINNTISCSSCHKQSFGFSDNARFSTGFESTLTTRNSMPIQNLGLVQPTFIGASGVSSSINDIAFNPTKLFWDGRESSLNNMVLKPLVNHVEMGVNDIDAFTRKVSGIPYYKDLFTNAFGTPDVNTQKIARALEGFVRSIQSNNTRFDRYVRATGGFSLGVTGVPIPDMVPGLAAKSLEYLTATEFEGAQLFFKKYDCNSCHQVQTPNGYSTMGGGFANIGLDKEYDDKGLSGVSNKPMDNGKFKIPSLRNVALTAPYMHDGRFETLEEVVNHYKNGIKDHPNLDPRLRNPDHSPMSIAISTSEANAIIAFLHTLTDVGMITDPKFSSPFMAQ